MAKKSVLAREAVAAGIATALESLSGREVAPAIIKLLNERHEGATIEDDDVTFYRAEVVKRLNPNSETSKRRVGADVANMCAAYVTLPLAIDAFKGKAKNAQTPAWFIVARLAMRIKKGDTVAKAVKHVKDAVKPKDKVAAKDRDLETAKASVKHHIERILEHTQLPASFRKLINEAAIELGIR